MPNAVIVGGARTPLGKFMGGLASLSAQDLGGISIAAALRRSGVPAEAIEYVIMGQVLQAGQGQITARQAAVKGGVGMQVPCITINKVCLSGLNAIALAAQLIRLGDIEVAVAGGMESMSRAPFALNGAREGLRMGDTKVIDLMIRDGLWCAFDDRHMGVGSDVAATSLGVSREEQDEWAARSHETAATAMKAGYLAEEIEPVTIAGRKGDSLTVESDEGVRPETTVESLSKLRPAFASDGTITAGNASQISDGACAVVVTSEEFAASHGLDVLARIDSGAMVAGPDASLENQPSGAIQALAKKTGVAADSFDLYEINEAFASVAVWSTKQLGAAQNKVNVNGGAIALGHPIGMSGARLALTLALELRRRGGGSGVAALCGGGGQGEALAITVT